MLKAYKHLFIQHSATLLFGMLAVFAGNVGQSFFISWYGAPIQTDLKLSATTYGSVYSAATLCSGLAIMALGGWVDKMPVRRFFTLAMLGLVVACLSLWQVSGLATLFVGFLLLRFFGQGLLPHTAAVHMSRHFSLNRGKALSISGLGVPLGEVILPVLAVFMLTLSHWQQNWLWIAIVNLVLIWPLGYWLLGHLSQAEDSAQAQTISSTNTTNAKPASRRTLLKDLRFWRVLPLVLMPPFAITGIFIHQASILEGMQWSPALFASAFVVYGVLHWLGAIFAGALIDKYSAMRLVTWIGVPFVLAFAGCALVQADFMVWVMLFLLGLGISIASILITAMWAEVYGTQNLGSIRSLVSSLSILSTALSPVLFGYLLDYHTSVALLFGLLAIYAAFCTLLSFRAYQG